jgi:hypothetical protein
MWTFLEDSASERGATVLALAWRVYRFDPTIHVESMLCIPILHYFFQVHIPFMEHVALMAHGTQAQKSEDSGNVYGPQLLMVLRFVHFISCPLAIDTSPHDNHVIHVATV